MPRRTFWRVTPFIALLMAFGLGCGTGTSTADAGCEDVNCADPCTALLEPCAAGQECIARSGEALCVPYVRLVSGANHSCNLNGAGQVRCWGDNRLGQLGSGTITPSSIASAVSGISGQTLEIASGDATVCAMSAINVGDAAPNHVVSCWGAGTSGQLGDGASLDRAIPIRVPSAESATAIQLSLGNQHTCLLFEGRGTEDGTSSFGCFGANGSGQLADGTTLPRSTFAPSTLSTVAGASRIFARHDVTCGQTTNGTGCIGGGTLFGFEEVLGPRTSALEVRTIPTIGAIADLDSSATHACSVNAIGEVWCWGDNRFGQLGDGTQLAHLTPRRLLSLTNASTVALGANHTCALTQSGEVWCWGDNRFGQLGDGTNLAHVIPARVVSIRDAIALSCGETFCCAANSSAVVSCWGDNRLNQLGDGTDTQRTLPTLVL